MKPIVGCEFNIVKIISIKPKGQWLPSCSLAKNKKYHNLAKMASIANINGFYYVPRSTRILSSTKRISWYYPETYMEKFRVRFKSW
jgi:DNA polymerase-3 subunit alpha